MTDNAIKDHSFILFGALRSGTTLLRLMINSHPQITCPGEMDFLIEYLDPSGAYDLDALKANRIYRAHEALYPDAPIANPTPENLVKRVSGAKGDMAALIMHRHLDRAVQVYKGIRVVHLIRDPRDVARSSIGMGWAGNPYYGVEHWIGTQTDWQHALPDLPEDQRLVVHFEDLIAKPQETLSAICEFVGLSYDPRMLSYDEGSTYSKPDTTLVRQWERKQSPRETGLVEAKIGPMLEQAGYTASGRPAHPPGLGERVSLWVENKRAQWTFRIGRYGFKDPVWVRLVEKLGMPKLGRAARQRMDAIQIRHLK